MSPIPVEHEARFLIVDDHWPRSNTPERLTQGYLSTQAERVVRVRQAGEAAWLTIKGKDHKGSRSEFEYSIPPEHAACMLQDMCEGHIIDKWRHRIAAEIPGLDDAHWEIDVFLADNAGLVVAEIEVPSPAHFEVVARHRPSWLGPEITQDYRYANSALARLPYRSWPCSP